MGGGAEQLGDPSDQVACGVAPSAGVAVKKHWYRIDDIWRPCVACSVRFWVGAISGQGFPEAGRRQEVTAKSQASRAEPSREWPTHVAGTVEAGTLWEPIRVWVGLKETCLLFLSRFLRRLLEDRGHRVVSAVAIPCAWADSCVVGEEVEEWPHKGSRVSRAHGMRKRCCGAVKDKVGIPVEERRRQRPYDRDPCLQRPSGVLRESPLSVIQPLTVANGSSPAPVPNLMGFESSRMVP